MILRKKTILYRAAIFIESQPTPRKCPDTKKIGTYFSAFSPFLSETMCLEYNSKLYVAVYEVQKNIKLNIGKYGFTLNKPYYYNFNTRWEKVYQEDNVSHIDFNICAISEDIICHDNICAEVFLVEKDLSKIKYLGHYNFTPEECLDKYSNL